MKKSILVLMSTYNGEKYLKEQIDSVIAQNGVEVYLLIRDDGSSDNTCEMIESYQKNEGSKIIEFIRGENLGFGNSFSDLVKRAYDLSRNNQSFDYYAFADQDDVWLENKLSVAAATLDKYEDNEPLLYCSNSTLVDENLNIIGYYKNKFYTPTKGNALVEGFANGCTMVYNSEALKLYAENVIPEIKVHDFYLYQAVTLLGKVIYDKESYIYYRQHRNNQIGKQSFYTRWKRRLKKEIKYELRDIQKKNYYLLKSIGHLLSIEDVTLISKIAFYHKNFKSKIGLIADKDIKYSTLRININITIKIILGIF